MEAVLSDAAGVLLRAAGAADAHLPLRPGDELPFEDRSAVEIRVGERLSPHPFASRVQFLLECRRVLRPGGMLRLVAEAAAHSRPDEEDASGIARLVGLACCERPGHGEPGPWQEFTKPDRRVVDAPVVSIVIPAFNHRYFETALESAVAQSYEGIEIVVCDDSPGPEIEAIARRSRRRPVRYARNEQRLGARGNFSRCLTRASGEFVKFLCDDDVLAPGCVERLLAAFRDASDVTLATSARQPIDAGGAPVADLPATLPILDGSAVVAGYTLASAMIMAGLNTIGEPSSALVRKTDLAPHPPDPFRFRGTAGRGVIDMVMWSTLLLKGDAVYLRERLSSFRIHAEQRQHDPGVRERSVASIRALQAAWLPLGLHERLPPHLLLAMPFPPQRAGPWRRQPITGYAARPA